MRKCIACGRVSTKSDLVRFVRTASGEVALDPTGRAAGRGGYVCADRKCFDAMRKRRGLDKALRMKVDDEAYARLSDEFYPLCAMHGDQ